MEVGPPLDLCSLPFDALEKWVVGELGEKPYRAKQIFRWLHQRGATSFEEMSDLSKPLRERLAGLATASGLTLDLEQRSQDRTLKFRWKTDDGQLIESVYMPSPDRKTLCVSTQVGCAMGCTFCMTATLGLMRNLTPAEIVVQVHAVNAELRSAGDNA